MIGIIPAAGKAERFSGINKELLPIKDNRTLYTTGLESAIRRANKMGAREALVITTERKIAAHAYALRDIAFPVSFVLQKGDELWGAISSTFYRQEDSLLIMPDTVFTIVESIPRSADIAFGLFSTSTPERYSIYTGDTIRTKPVGLHGIQKAWGVVYWSKRVIELWNGIHYNHYDDAFNDAINKVEHKTFAIHNYCDLGSMEHYKDYLNGN